MSILKAYLVLLTISTITGVNSELNTTVAFSNVTVIGSECNETLRQRINIVSSKNLNEDSTIRSFCDIHDIKGPLTVLLSNSVTDLPKLRNFEIHWGQLKQIQPGTFRNLPNLEHIWLVNNDHNALEEVEEGVFSDLPIRSLVLIGNGIRKIAPRAFHNMTNLQLFHLQKSNITRWDISWFQNTPKLSDFLISSHKFEELPERAFKSLRNGTDVMVSFIHGDLIKIGDNLFDGLEEINVLDLEFNKIEVFGDGVVKGVKKMGELRLRYNRIKCFSGDLSSIFVADKTFIDYNPVACDEGCMKNVTSWLKSEGGHEVSAKVKDSPVWLDEYCSSI